MNTPPHGSRVRVEAASLNSWEGCHEVDTRWYVLDKSFYNDQPVIDVSNGLAEVQVSKPIAGQEIVHDPGSGHRGCTLTATAHPLFPKHS